MKIDECVENLISEMVKDKEFFWNHPEEEFKEFETSEYIIKRLKQIGYTDIKTNIAKTGIVATIGNGSSPCILFRADMDAVVMDENHRMKHTCGHDAHMTMLLALATLLMQNKEKINGTAKLLFQPAEEGNGGAQPMIDEGVLENPHVDKVFGMHVWSELPECTVGIKEGCIMASTDPFDMVVTGRGGHGALPEKCIDPISIASAITTALQVVVGRNVASTESAVVGITSIHGGSSYNVIPDIVEMKGICRTYNNNLRDYIKTRIDEVATGIASSMGGKVEISYPGSRPAVENSKEEAQVIKELASDIVGKENVITNYRTMCSEDFSFFLQNRPGAFIFIGCQGEKYYAQHNENFTVSKDAIVLGTEMWYKLAKRYLGLVF
jgi:amidohydrolase